LIGEVIVSGCPWAELMSSLSLQHRTKPWLSSLATYDFAPRFSAKVRRLVYHPLGVLTLAALAALLCGLFLHAQGFVLCGSVFAVLALGVAWPWLSLRGVVASVSFDRAKAIEGETVETRLTLRNRFPWPAWGLALRGGFHDDPSDAVAGIASIPRCRTSLCRWSFKPLCRGIYPQTLPFLTTGFPFGLWERRQAASVASPLVVWPRTFPVGPIPPVSGAHQVEGNVSRSKVGTNGDVLGVRPYRRGDSPRRIHWGQSARYDRLIVCELQSNSRPVIQIILDADPHVHAGTGSDSSREWAIRIVASFAKGWLADGAQVGVSWSGCDIAPASGPAQLSIILGALAALPADTPSPLASVLACPKCRGFREGLQVIVTTDAAHIHGGCMTCEAEDQRWVVLKTSGFSERSRPNACGHCPTPWLTIDSAESVPALLKGAWREAQHGS
jgi:uncharacterized protein (DUF58 family)